MVRFVLGPDGQLVPDISAKLPGRGLWLSADAAALDKAVRKNLFAKAARQAVHVPVHLGDLVGRQLTTNCLNLLGLARRAGEALTGYQQVKDALQAGKVTVLITANDAAENARKKIAGSARHCRHIELFSRAELDLALGQQNVVHAALVPGGLADRFSQACARLAGFRPQAADDRTRGRE